MADPSPPRKTSLDRAAAAFLAPAQEPDEIGRLGEYRILKVLKTMPLGALGIDNDANLQTLRTIWSLTHIQSDAAIKFWLKADPSYAAYLQWIDQTRKLGFEEQKSAVIEKMKERNPAFDGKLSVTPIGDKIVSVAFSSVGVTDISLLRGFPNLAGIDCSAPAGKKSKLRDLSPLRGMKLTNLDISRTAVDDLEPIRWLPITILKCKDAPIDDLSPIARMPLQELRFDLRPERDFRILAGIDTLTTINDQPAATALRQFGPPASRP